MIQVGVGVQGTRWCEQYLPPNVADGTIRVVGAIDADYERLATARDALDLPADRCYTDTATAFSELDADFCSVVVPPHAHETVVDLAIEHDLHVLSEKPIADTMHGSVRIAEKMADTDLKMGVTMTHRFDRDKTTLRRELQSWANGPIDYLVCRFTCDYRNRGSWDDRLYDVDYPLLMDGAVHHLDLLANLADTRAETVYTQSWNPEWSDFAGDAQALVIVIFENGIRAQYEAAVTNAYGLNGWGHEYIRAEARDGTVILNGRELERLARDPNDPNWASEGDGEVIPLLEREKWGNAWLIEQFVDWLDGGNPMPTAVGENLHSMAAVFAAIESAESGEVVNVSAFLDNARESEGY